MSNHLIFPGPGLCPECRSDELEPVSDGERVNFFCPSCASCWHLELGFVSRLGPGACPGCEQRDRCSVARS